VRRKCTWAIVAFSSRSWQTVPCVSDKKRLSRYFVPQVRRANSPSPLRDVRRVRRARGGEAAGASGSGSQRREGGVRQEALQHGHRVGGLPEGGQHLEQPRERCLVPDEQPGSISQGPDALPASVAFGTLVGPL